MNKKRAFERSLRTELLEYEEMRLEVLALSCEDISVSISADFLQTMDSLIKEQRSEKHRLRQPKLAAAMLAVVLILAAFFSIPSQARAAALNWIRDTWQNGVVYHFRGAKQEKNLPNPMPKWIPEDFSLLDEYVSDAEHTLVYGNAEGDGFIISCIPVTEGEGLYIFDPAADTRQNITAEISEWKVDCFLAASPEENSDYVWFSSNESFSFSMNSTLPHDVNVQIISSMKE